MPKLSFAHDMMTDFEGYAGEAEPYLEKKVMREYVIAVLLFCAGVAALMYSNFVLGAALLVAALHYDQQSNTHHLLLLMTMYRRAKSQVIDA